MGRLANGFPKASEAEWLKRVAHSLKGRPLASLTSRTLDDIAVEPLYHGAPAPAPARRPLPKPGEPPWTVVQRVDMPDLARARAQALEDLENGAGGLAIVLPRAVTAGRHGVPITGLDDLRRLIDGIDLDLISVRLDPGGHWQRAAGLLIELYQALNFDLGRCRVSFGVDPLGDFARTGSLMDEEALIAWLGATVGAIARRGHRGPALVADARVYHGAGATEAQELASALATAVQYVRWLEQAGFDVAQAVPRIGFLLSADADQFLTVAKLRAARHLWANATAALELEPAPAVIQVETAMRMMSRRDPHVNLLRTTTAAFAAGVGGADEVTVLPFTAALGLADGFARRLARNIQTILQEESGIGTVADPAAGSGYVEALTTALAAKAWELFQSIERAGGMLEALASGLVQERIAEAAARRRRDVAERRQSLTGVSEFPQIEEPPVTILDVPLPEEWEAAVRQAEAAAAVTITCPALVQARLAEPYEILRDAADAAAARIGRRPAVFLANLGPRSEFNPRATWVENWLAAGGIAALGNEGFSSPDLAARAFKESGASVACLCSSDRISELAAATAIALKKAGAARLYLAGRPAELRANLEEAGVDEFLHHGIDALAALERLHRALRIEPLPSLPG